MANAAGIVRRLDSALRRVAPPQRSVYKRFVTKTGGDNLIGRAQTITYTDTLLNPQPLYQRLGRNVVGAGADIERFIQTSGTDTEIADSYALVVSPTALSLAELENKNLLLVLKQTNTSPEETFRVEDFERIGLTAVDVMYIVYMRSTARP